jgi:hypothetical protein
MFIFLFVPILKVSLGFEAPHHQRLLDQLSSSTINANFTTNNIGPLLLLILLLYVKKEEIVASPRVKAPLRFIWQMSFHQNWLEESSKLFQTIVYTILTNLAV